MYFTVGISRFNGALDYSFISQFYYYYIKALSKFYNRNKNENYNCNSNLRQNNVFAGFLFIEIKSVQVEIKHNFTLNFFLQIFFSILSETQVFIQLFLSISIISSAHLCCGLRTLLFEDLGLQLMKRFRHLSPY